MQALGGSIFDLNAQIPPHIEPLDYIPILALGMLCALLGISIMRGVTLTEELFRRSRVPVWLRPAIGGLAVGALALVTPAVLSSGHGALGLTFEMHEPLTLDRPAGAAEGDGLGDLHRLGLSRRAVLRLAVPGRLAGQGVRRRTGAGQHRAMRSRPAVCVLVGMSALAVAIIGGPLTMGFLALEATGSLPMTVAVLAACVVSSLTVRRTFGYSFATWRFHLRGEAIRSAVDIGWMRNLTVGRMMRRDMRTVRADTPLTDVQARFPAGLRRSA